jgi:hypothetical protein
MENDILFITAFKDIGRNNWNMYRRTNEEYINNFLNLANNITYKLIVYLDDELKNNLLVNHSFNENISFYNLSTVNTFYNKYLNKENEIMSSNEFKKLIPPHRLYNNPETWCAKYTLINHSKINFVSHSKKIYPNYNFYSWIDFGYVINVNLTPKNININKLPHKIIYHAFKHPLLNKKDALQMLQIDDPVIAGGAYIIPNELIETFEQIYENKILFWQQNGICDDDQSLILQLYYENMNLFHLILNSNWFALYNSL